MAATTTAALAAGLLPFLALAAPAEAQTANNAVQRFASPADAELFLSEALPKATAANPKYRTPGADYERRWLIKTVTFPRSRAGGLAVATDEAFDDYQDGAVVASGTHQATFALDEVAISPETAADVTETGDKAMGVLFHCLGPPCIQSIWDGKQSLGVSTDIYIQDAVQRDKVISAFRALQGYDKSH